MAIYPYVFYKESELKRLSTQVSDRLVIWANQWLSNEDEIRLDSIIPFDINDCVYGKQSVLVHMVLSEGRWIECWLKEKDIGILADNLLPDIKARVIPITFFLAVSYSASIIKQKTMGG